MRCRRDSIKTNCLTFVGKYIKKTQFFLWFAIYLLPNISRIFINIVKVGENIINGFFDKELAL